MTACPLIIAAVLITSPLTEGEEADALDTALRSDQQFHLTFTPGVWIPRATGDVQLGDGPLNRSVDVRDDLDLDDQEATANIELVLERGNWRLHFSGYDFSTDGDPDFSRAFAFGDAFVPAGGSAQTSLDITSAAVELGYTALTYDGTTTWTWREPGAPADASGLRLTPYAGLRYLDVDFDFDAGAGGSDGSDESWLALYGGLHAAITVHPRERLPWLHMVRIEADLGIGPAFGGDGGFMWQVSGGLTLAPTPNVGVLIGYRLVELNVEADDDFDYEGGLQGLFLAASIRF